MHICFRAAPGPVFRTSSYLFARGLARHKPSCCYPHVTSSDSLFGFSEYNCPFPSTYASTRDMAATTSRLNIPWLIGSCFVLFSRKNRRGFNRRDSLCVRLRRIYLSLGVPGARTGAECAHEWRTQDLTSRLRASGLQV